MTYAVIFTAEIAISHWPDEDRIRACREDPGHLAAQQTGRSRWYRAWSVHVAEVTRSYQRGSAP